MPNALQLDPSARVPIENIRVGKSFAFLAIFDQTITGTWTAGFYKDDSELHPVQMLEEGTDFNISGMVITFYVSKARNKLRNNCFWRMSQAAGTAEVLSFQGRVIVLQ